MYQPSILPPPEDGAAYGVLTSTLSAANHITKALHADNFETFDNHAGKAYKHLGYAQNLLTHAGKTERAKYAGKVADELKLVRDNYKRHKTKTYHESHSDEKPVPLSTFQHGVLLPFLGSLGKLGRSVYSDWNSPEKPFVA